MRVKLKIFPAWMYPAPDSISGGLIRQGKSPWSDSVHLMWSIWVFVTPVFDRSFDWQWVWLTVASYPLFLFLFAMTLLASVRTRGWYSIALIAMSMVMLPWYPSAISYFIYGCCTRPTSNTLLRSTWRLVGFNALLLLEAWAVGLPWQFMLWIPILSLTIGTVINVESMTHEKDRALKLSQDEVRRLAATAERERIGRDLHDLLGHTLSLITLKLELSRKLFDRDAAASRRELEEAEKVARHALAEVRAAVTGIRSTDLAAELASSRLLLESSSVHLDCSALPTSLPVDIERALALVVREAMTNIHRHAAATEVQVRFAATTEKLDMHICDNGRGGLILDGNGVSGMRERVRALGGSLTIESPTGRGTRLIICVPLPKQRPPVARAELSRDDGASDGFARGLA
jgi:two-component system sensor histidine kinase DesK